MKFILGLIASGLLAQTPASLQSIGCRGNTIQIMVSVPLAAGAITVPVPVCAELGPGLVLNTAVTPPRLEAVAAPVVQPRAVVQKFAMPAALPASSNTLSITLAFTPHSASPILAAFRSSRVGGDVVEFVMPGGGSAPKVLDVTVPSYRPFTADDGLTVTYWTLEPAP